MKAQGLSCRALGRAAGVAPSTVSRLLQPQHTELPHRDTILALEEALGFTAHELSGSAPEAEQLPMWPGRDLADIRGPEVWVIRALRALPAAVRLDAARAAVATIIEAAVRSDVVAPELHQCLATLDVARVEAKQAARRRSGRAKRPGLGRRARDESDPFAAKMPFPAAG
jgi:hypothetical protein